MKEDLKELRQKLVSGQKEKIDILKELASIKVDKDMLESQAQSSHLASRHKKQTEEPSSPSEFEGVCAGQAMLHSKLDQLAAQVHALQRRGCNHPVPTTSTNTTRDALSQPQDKCDKPVQTTLSTNTSWSDIVRKKPRNKTETTASKDQSTASQGAESQADQKKLLLGASIVRDVKPRGLRNTDVVSIGPALNCC